MKTETKQILTFTVFAYVLTWVVLGIVIGTGCQLDALTGTLSVLGPGIAALIVSSRMHVVRL